MLCHSKKIHEKQEWAWIKIFLQRLFNKLKSLIIFNVAEDNKDINTGLGQLKDIQGLKAQDVDD